MTDLIERLRRTYTRAFVEPNPTTGVAMVRSYLLKESRLINPDGPEAADYIERLEAENVRLRGAVIEYKRGFGPSDGNSALL